MKILQIAILLLFYVAFASCSTFQRQKVRWGTELSEAKNPTEKFPSVRRIALDRFTAKPANFAGFTSENFTNNLRFFLLKEEIDVVIQESLSVSKTQDQTSQTSASAPAGASSASSNPSATTSSLLSAAPPLSSDSGEKPFELSKETIQKACALAKCDLYIDGYIYEKKTGNILDEQFTTGIFVRIYSSSGSLVGQVKVNSSAPTEIFENNSTLAEMVAGRLASLIGRETNSGFKWKFWE
ncbi:hypothetical protein CH373_10515 [Leptospira perolatii]|uniref:Lipoprotein n=1 Tax=Leptospira perolatii TaxID=2023191 RepID=A0A2M9ZMX6_9LEPT|nr:lipoprotein [Leptospira perolatii]PJZ68291.1 hypothetical protein CH360_16955 [Leptospira perolatii]PJZ73422.1 hypothetical protein CH373_10515 [Leptospira perolatii]